MNNPAYILFDLFSRLLCSLPKRGMYVVADLLYIIAYYFIGYRKKVVFTNLQNAFPEKSAGEIKAIAKRFYKHLADIMVENFAILNMNEKKVRRFIRVKNAEVMENIRKQNKNVIALTAHYGNWEFMSTLSPHTSFTILSVYKPLRNKFFDRKVYQMRKRFGSVPVPMKTVYKEIIKRKEQNNFFILGLVSDQSPPKKYVNYWTTFLNQETAFFTGGEKIAKKFNDVPVFTIVKKVKRGLYEIEFQTLHKNPHLTEDMEITEKYVRALEQTIRENPEYWLWSHRRWKYKKDDLK